MVIQFAVVSTVLLHALLVKNNKQKRCRVWTQCCLVRTILSRQEMTLRGKYISSGTDSECSIARLVLHFSVWCFGVLVYVHRGLDGLGRTRSKKPISIERICVGSVEYSQRHVRYIIQSSRMCKHVTDGYVCHCVVCVQRSEYILHMWRMIQWWWGNMSLIALLTSLSVHNDNAV